MRQGLTQIVLKFWHTFGVDLLFVLETADTFTNREKERQSLTYMSQKLLPKLNQKILNLVKRGEKLTGNKSGHSDLVCSFKRITMFHTKTP